VHHAFRIIGIRVHLIKGDTSAKYCLFCDRGFETRETAERIMPQQHFSPGFCGTGGSRARFFGVMPLAFDF
jgi:hypothetical protein